MAQGVFFKHQNRGNLIGFSVLAGRGMREKEWGYYYPTGLVEKYIDFVSEKISGRRNKKRFARNIMRFKKIYDIEKNNIKFRCHTKGNATERNLVFRGLGDDDKLISIICSYLKEGDIFFDVGANCGSFSLLLSGKVNNRGQVIAIEPNPEMLRRIEFNVSINNIHNIEILPFAISNEDGEQIFFCNERQLGNSGLVKKDKQNTFTVKTKRLLTIVEELNINKIDFMKVDIEGYEHVALKPFYESAPQEFWPKAILIENNEAYSDENKIIELLISIGYKIRWHGKSDDLLILT